MTSHIHTQNENVSQVENWDDLKPIGNPRAPTSGTDSTRSESSKSDLSAFASNKTKLPFETTDYGKSITIHNTVDSTVKSDVNPIPLPKRNPILTRILFPLNWPVDGVKNQVLHLGIGKQCHSIIWVFSKNNVVLSSTNFMNTMAKENGLIRNTKVFPPRKYLIVDSKSEYGKGKDDFRK